MISHLRTVKGEVAASWEGEADQAHEKAENWEAKGSDRRLRDRRGMMVTKTIKRKRKGQKLMSFTHSDFSTRKRLHHPLIGHQ